MWNKEKSVLLTGVIVRLCYVILTAAVIALPFIFKHAESFEKIRLLSQWGKYVMGPFYAIAPAGYAALICIDKLLCNIKKDAVFDAKNVRLLRTISWSCFFAAAECAAAFVLISLTYTHTAGLALVLLAAGAGFMGLVVRVIKNVFEAAIEIKDENDLTI